MAHRSFIHGGLGNGTAWATGYVLTQLDLQSFDQAQFESIDGDNGGTWAPATAIIIGGAGLHLAAGLVITGGDTTIGGGALVVTAPAGFAGFTTFSGDALFESTVTFDPTATLSVNSAATFGAAVVFGAGFASNDPSLFTDNVTFGGGVVAFTNGASFNTGGAVGFAVPVTVASTLALQGTTTNTGTIANSGPGHVVKRPRFSMPDANGTSIGVTTGGSGNGADTLNVETGSLTANRSITITSTGATNGSRFLVNSDEGIFKLTIKQDSGAAICDVQQGGGFGPAASGFRWVELEHNGGANGWRILRGHGSA